MVEQIFANLGGACTVKVHCSDIRWIVRDEEVAINRWQHTEQYPSVDAKLIGKVKGIGPKTAQRIVIDLKDKIKKSGATVAGVTSVSPQNMHRDEALAALQQLSQPVVSPSPPAETISIAALTNIGIKNTKAA